MQIDTRQIVVDGEVVFTSRAFTTGNTVNASSRTHRGANKSKVERAAKADLRRVVA